MFYLRINNLVSIIIRKYKIISDCGNEWELNFFVSILKDKENLWSCVRWKEVYSFDKCKICL